MNKDENAYFKSQLDEMAAKVDAAAVDNAFIGMNEVYKQMREAGFTMVEACTIIGTWISYSVGHNKGDGHD